MARYARLTPSDAERIGRHRESAPQPLGTLLMMVAKHNATHLEQIRRYFISDEQVPPLREVAD